ncbi:hypothetical protein BaRGS_00025867, partial [Batillaria attramentaria]
IQGAACSHADSPFRSSGQLPDKRDCHCSISTDVMTGGHASTNSNEQQMTPAPNFQQCPMDQPSPNIPSRHPRLTSSLASPSSSTLTSSSPHHCVRRLLLLSLSLAALTAVAVGMSSLKKEYALQIGVPSSKLIRKVRMFTEHPELKEIARSTSSLALISRLQLIDLSGCHGNLSECETVAVCDGGDNDLVCRCRRGYYFQDQLCKECRKSCQDGHYLVTPCSADADAVCKRCTPCSGSQYEAAACTSTRDTICVDVTFPVGILPMNDTLGFDDGTPIGVTHSKNIFMERLIHMKELETPMYVTNNQQSMNFVWHRESGIDIIISVSGVYLLPEYRELDVTDDSIFFLQKGRLTEPQETMDLFAKTQAKYCRHPVPDYYDLVMQIRKNRTSAAEVVRCDSKDTSVSGCPSSYKDGDRYLKWDINKRCDKHAGSADVSLSEIKGHVNEVVCTDETGLDVNVFRQPRPATLEMMFPSTGCSVHQTDCKACLAAATCSNESDDQSCCSLSCYSKAACLQAYSPNCPPTQVECASGEVRIFNLQPSFANMAREFNCHLTYEPPGHLYNISYFLTMPSLNFTLPLQNYTAAVRSTKEHQRGKDKFDFINLWHDTRMPVTDDLILTGNHRELEKIGDIHMKPFVIHSLKKNHEFARRRGMFDVKSESDSQYRTAVQFERPFTFSSQTWHRSGCDKNMSQIFPNQTLYKNDATHVLARKRQDQFLYQMYHADRSPYIKFSVAEGATVLRWFQGKTTHGTIIGEELSGRLIWNTERTQWTISISGAMRNCPGIFTIQVFNKMMSSCIGVYDVLAACPKHFNFTLTVSRTDSDLPDIFVVFLNDSQSSHRIVLSSVITPVDLPASGSSAVTAASRSQSEGLEVWIPIFSVVILFVLGIFVVFVVYLCIKFKSMKGTVGQTVMTANAETPALNNQPSNSTAHKPAETKNKTSSSTRTCLCVFVILYILYSIIFTFSVILVILYFTHLSLMGNIGGIANFSAQLQKEVNVSISKVQAHENQEEIRLFRSVESRLQACSQHLQLQNQQFLQKYHNAVTESIREVFQKDGVIESLTGESILQNTSVYTKEIQQFLVDCNKTIQSILDRFEAHFMIYAKEVMRNPWLDFPREIFLEQEGETRTKRKYMSANQMARFLHWLQVDKTDELLQVRETMAAGLSRLKLPSPTKYLMQAMSSPTDDFISSIPTEPMVAGHKFLVLERPDLGSDTPAFYMDPSTSTSNPKPQAAFFYSGSSDDKMNLHDDGVRGGSSAESETDRSENGTDSSQESEDSVNLFLYILIGLFILIDILLFVYRMSWMVSQVRAAKEGYEDRIPTDIVSQRILAIQTGYHIGRMQDMYEPYSYQLENRENMTAEERASETEFNVYFCQSYPKSKDDILREIMAQKMSSQEKGLSGEGGMAAAPSRQQGVQKFGIVQEVLVGGQSAARDLQLQVHMTNHHLAGLADHLSTVLEEHRAAVDAEITNSTALLSATLHTQRELLLALLESVCQGATTPACSMSTHSFLPLATLPAWQSCTFLPVWPHLYQDLSTQHLDQMVAQQLSPLLDTVKHCLFSLSAILMTALCIMFLCHAGATVARYYMIIWGRVPRVQIYQISENTSLLYDGAPGSQKPMQRSASWLESCESGVYVGESEDTNTNRDV